MPIKPPRHTARPPSRVASTRRTAPLALALVLAALAACGDGTAEVDNLYLRVTSDAPLAGGRIDGLRILFAQGDVRVPIDTQDPVFNPKLGNLDPVQHAVVISVRYDGASFGAGKGVTLEVLGKSGETVVARFEDAIDVSQKKLVDVHLSALGATCDADADGFVDCTVAGCCVGGKVLSDCAPDAADGNPWGTEVACEPCSDTIDQDCKGGDQPCVDVDQDGVADCSETACAPNDPDVAPGFAERCDGKDNDCDGETDEGLTFNYQGKTLAKGDACGQGICAGGVVECDGAGGLACSTQDLAEEAELCGNRLDDDCNGPVDEGCPENDLDGDGFEAPADCDEYDSAQYPGRVGEPCCPASARGDDAAEHECDLDCDGDVTFCADGDQDGDGVTAAAGDCDDGDPRIHPEAAEKCGDGVDQDCFAGDLACAGVTDADHDGWGAADDCDDTDEDVRPDAAEVCNGVDDDCDGFTDEDNGSLSGRCGTDEGECVSGVSVCRNGGEFHGATVCVGAVGGPESEAACDGKDDDCDGTTDEDFPLGDLVPGDTCEGVGACGEGVVECAPGRTDLATCSTDADGSDPGDSPEVCDDVDNDCDGGTDEDLVDPAASDCERRGVCGAHLAAIVVSCTDGAWTCDYDAVPDHEDGTEVSCDGLDNDCDGGTDDEFDVGAGCDGADADSCANGRIACDPADGTKTFCDETQSSPTEVCDNLDNDCDGKTDEDFKGGSDGHVKLTGARYSQDNGKVLGDACGTGLCGAGVVSCNTQDRTALTCVTPTAPTSELCNDGDDDCNGQTDEPFVAGGSVKYDGGPYAGDANKVKGATCGTGVCAGGTVVCGSTTTLTCSSLSSVGAEACDGEDDDCDGQTDEGFPNQDGDALADCVDPDIDGDNRPNASDNCPTVSNPNQSDGDGDAIGDACDTCTDADHDGWGKPGADQSGCAKTGNDCDETNATDPDTDNRCGASDNCPSVANPTQDDLDGDNVGDVCDTCTDGDHDGYGRSGFVRSGCAQADVDCDDSNATDPDADNRCGAGDNCPSAQNADQSNLDGDATGDACDTCTDVDGDGWGHVGLTLSGCSGSTTESDCDDAQGNSHDADHDNICVLGGRATCADGTRTACDDNCPAAANADQADFDGDAVGDVCDPCSQDADGDGVCDIGFATFCAGGATSTCRDNCAGFANPAQTDDDGDGVGDACEEPFEVCGDCTDNDSSATTTDTGASCVERRYLQITTYAEGVDAGYAVSFTFDHAFIVAAGRSLASGADVRVYYRDPETRLWAEIDRVLDPESSWGATTTTIWFATQAPIDAGQTNTDYRIVFAPTAPATAAKADERQVFPAADLFERAAGATLGTGWTESDDPGAVSDTTSVGLAATQPTTSQTSLTVRSADVVNRPSASLAFPALTGGLWHWRIGWNMMNATDDDFAVYLQLGDSTAGWSDVPSQGAVPNGGVGPDLVWTGGSPYALATRANTFVAEGEGVAAATLGAVNARGNVDVVVDLDQGLWQADVTGTGTWSEVLDFSSPIDTVDRLRIVSSLVDSTKMTRNQVDYVIVRPMVAVGAEPWVIMGVEEPNACAPSGTPLVRYRLADAAGTDPVVDSGSGTAVDLDLATSTISYACAAGTCQLVQPYLSAPGAQGSLGWDFEQRGGYGVAVARVGGTNNKLKGLDGAGATTLEVVTWIWEVPASGRVTLAELVQSGNSTRQLALTLSGPASAPTLHAWVKGSDVGSWPIDPVVGGRMVLHLVYDASQADADEVKLYRDGVRQTGTTQNASDTYSVPNDGELLVGNHTSLAESPNAYIHYVAVYAAALSASEVLNNARVLRANDD